jgi:hypothetical protein
LYCYAGLELIKAAGEWNITVLAENSPSQEDDSVDGIEYEERIRLPLEEVQAWEKAPEDERIKLVAWLAKTMMDYMDGIISPKE